jgi:hypothetical protein
MSSRDIWGDHFGQELPRLSPSAARWNAGAKWWWTSMRPAFARVGRASAPLGVNAVAAAALTAEARNPRRLKPAGSSQHMQVRSRRRVISAIKVLPVSADLARILARRLVFSLARGGASCFVRLLIGNYGHALGGMRRLYAPA